MLCVKLLCGIWILNQTTLISSMRQVKRPPISKRELTLSFILINLRVLAKVNAHLKRSGLMVTRLDKILSENLKFPNTKGLGQRGIADKIEEQCNTILTSNFDDVQQPRSRRSIEDITVSGIYIDHKSSDEALKFKMPNLISIDRLKILDKPLIYNFVVYNSETQKIVKNFSLNVYELNWDYLSIQNLGAGQLQIKNMKDFLKSPKTTMTEDEWKERLRVEAVQFYDKLIKKTNNRRLKWIN